MAAPESGGSAPDAFHVLGYTEPARAFTEALPLGNGRLGAMCFGGAGEDLIRLNDGTAWSGSPASELAVPPQAAARNAEDLARARQLIADGGYGEAETFLTGLAQPYTQAYLPFADLLITAGYGPEAPDEGSYRRALDLRTGIHTHSYRWQGNTVVQRVLVSAVHGVLVVELEAEHPLELAVRLQSRLRILNRSSNPGDTGFRRPPETPDSRRPADEHGLQLLLPSDVAPLHAGPGAGVRYGGPSLAGAVVLSLEHDGEQLDRSGSGLRARAVRRALLYLATETTFTGIGAEPRGTADEAFTHARSRIREARGAGIDTVRSAHLAAHQELYNRAALSLGQPQESGKPAPAPLAAAVREVPDLISTPEAAPQLAALLFNYGRYLLLSASRPGSLPATLQGLWNEDLQPPWSSNYTLNINTEMNYWGAGAVNLAECFEPFFDLVAVLARTGRATAARTYGLPGWVAHHNTDAWAFSSPVAGDAAWSFWPLGAAWLSTQLAGHLRLGTGSAVRAQQVWPIIRSACRFYLGWLQQMPDGTLGTVPSTSPENHFQTADGTAAAARSSTADITMIRRLFQDAVDLGPEEDVVVQEAAAALALLPPVPVTATGLVGEWMDDFEHPDPNHRHISHLWFAYPGAAEMTPALALAVSRSLDARGDDSTGWSLVWKMALRARLGEPDAVGRLLNLILRDAGEGEGRQWAGGLYRNLFAAHPPFQIDGNLGYLAAVAECLVQSRAAAGHPRTLVLLPALPPQWQAGGCIRGLIVAPGIVAGVEWSGGDAGSVELVRAELRARTEQAAGSYLLIWNGCRHAVEIGTEAAVVIGPADFQDGSSQASPK